MKNPITINDIAFELGVSKSTVSRALRNEPNVKKEVRSKILAFAKEKGYTRNEYAINFRNKSTKIIGIVVPEMITSFYVNFITRIQSILYAKGFHTIISISNENPDIEKDNLLMMESYRVEGILISACHNKKNIDIYRRLIDKGIPLVFFDRTIDELAVPKVKIDDYIKSFFMMEYLIRSGRKQIIHLAGPSYIQNTLERKNAYRDALEKFHLPFNQENIIESGVNFEDGEKAMEAFMKKQIPFDAIFCFTEMSALGAKSFLQKLHYSIPEDVAICCVSGTVLSSLVYPTMTVIEQPVELMADYCIELLMEKLDNMDGPNRTVVLEAKMIIRDSTKVDE